MKSGFLCLLTILVVTPAQAYRVTYQPFGDEPGFVDKIPDPVPEPAVYPVGMHDARHPFTQPVARVNGTAVHRSLFRSVGGDPVDRALILRDYQKNGFALPPFELAGAFKRYQRIQFHGIDALRDLRLRNEKATLEDYRQFVAEEIKITTMLYLNARLGSTPSEHDGMIRDYVLRLRRKALIEKLAA